MCVYVGIVYVLCVCVYMMFFLRVCMCGPICVSVCTTVSFACDYASTGFTCVRARQECSRVPQFPAPPQPLISSSAQDIVEGRVLQRDIGP